MSFAKRWCFTLNNYDNADVTRLRQLAAGGDVRYLVFGREVGDSGTPHLQGFCSFHSRKRLRQVRALISVRAHFEVARGSDGSNRDYCIKDGDFEEFGESGGGQGSRNDIDEFRGWILAFFAEHEREPSERDVANAFPSLYLRYSKHLLSLSRLLLPPVKFNEAPLRDWQSDLFDALEEEADDRKITFVIDEEGGKGKSYFVRYCISKMEDQCQALSIGKRDDLAHAIDISKRIFFFNVPRGAIEQLQYTILEQLKDRMIFSPKYNSTMKLIRHRTHVVVFTNEEPDMSKMTQDRYNCIYI